MDLRRAVAYHQETLIARYRCAYDQRQKRLREVSHPTLYTTVFASPQLELIELDDTQWIKVQQRAWHRRTQRMTSMGSNLLVGLGTSALVFFYVRALGEVGRTCSPTCALYHVNRSTPFILSCSRPTSRPELGTDRRNAVLGTCLLSQGAHRVCFPPPQHLTPWR